MQSSITTKAGEAIGYLAMTAFLLRIIQAHVERTMGDVPKLCALLAPAWLILFFIVRKKFGRRAWLLLLIFPEPDVVLLIVLLIACVTGTNCL